MIYFIMGRLTQLVKIGRADNPLKRLDDLQIGSPDKLSIIAMLDITREDSIKYETYFHRRWSHLLVRGEWYTLDKELIAFIRVCAQQPDIILNIIEGRKVKQINQDPVILKLEEEELCQEKSQKQLSALNAEQNLNLKDYGNGFALKSAAGTTGIRITQESSNQIKIMCLNCDAWFVPRRHWARFCSKKCRKDYWDKNHNI